MILSTVSYEVNMRFLLSIVSSSLVIGQVMIGQAFACIGNGESYQIGLRHGSKAGEQIVILREQKSGRYQEIVDDTGYVGVHLGVTSLSKDADRNGKTVPNSHPTVQFLQARVEYMKKYFSQNLPADMRRPVKAAESLEKALQADPVSTDQLTSAISEFSGALYEDKIEITAAERKSPSEKFGEEVPFNQLGLPTYLRMRSMGCNAGISSFNTSISKSGGATASSSGGSPVSR